MKELSLILRAAALWIVRGACACACLLPLSCAFGDADAVGSLFDENEDPLFVAVGMDTLANYSIHSSLTGSVWTRNLTTLGEAGTLRFAVYGDGMFMTGGSGATFNFYMSPDGLLWARGSTGGGPSDPGTLYDGVYANGRFVVVGHNNDGEAMAYTSMDGLAWVNSNLDNRFNGALHGVTYGNGMFVAVGNQVGDSLVVASTDGIVWTGNLRQASPLTLNDVAYGNGIFVAVGFGGMASVSADGLAWSEDHVIGKDLMGINGITYGRDRFVAVGNVNGFGYGVVYLSHDGLAWTNNINNGWMLSAFQDITYCHGYFVAVTDSGMAAVSPQGFAWDSKSVTGSMSLYGITCRP